MPGCGGLPRDFLRETPRRSLVVSATNLLLDFARDGQIPRLRPRDGESPANLALRMAAGALEQDLLRTVGTRIECEFATALEGQGAVVIHVLPDGQQPPNVDVRHFRAACDALHPALHANLMDRLRSELAPFWPIYTAYDAALAFQFLYFDDDWYGEAVSAFMDAHPQQLEPDDVVLFAWLDKQGALNPNELTRRFPSALYVRDPDLDLDELLARLPHPAASPLLKLLAALDQVPAPFRAGREEPTPYDPGHDPGRVTVMIEHGQAQDSPTLEMYREVQEACASDEPEFWIGFHVRHAEDFQQVREYCALQPRMRALATAAFGAMHGEGWPG